MCNEMRLTSKFVINSLFPNKLEDKIMQKFYFIFSVQIKKNSEDLMSYCLILWRPSKKINTLKETATKKVTKRRRCRVLFYRKCLEIPQGPYHTRSEKGNRSENASEDESKSNKFGRGGD